MAEEILQNITRMPESQQLLADVCHIIDEARQNVAQAANSALTMMYWQIGNTIHNYTLDGQRAAYGQQIVSALSTKLSWSHFMEVLPIKDNTAREFYVTMAASEHWSLRMLRKQIDSMLFERTVISRQPEEFYETLLVSKLPDRLL